MDTLNRIQQDHWHTLRVTIQVNDKLMAGKPANLDVAKAMLKARELDDQIEAVSLDDPEAREAAAEEVEKESKCEFHRRPGIPGIWMPSNNIKAMVKENWSVLGFRDKFRGSNKAIAEGVFIFGEDERDPEWVYLGEKPDGEEPGVVHSMGKNGPQHSLKNHEFVSKAKIVFLVKIAEMIKQKIPPDALVRTFYHGMFHGLGADRSQGRGTHKVLAIDDLGNIALSKEQQSAAA
jgi:hypothetical protein